MKGRIRFVWLAMAVSVGALLQPALADVRSLMDSARGILGAGGAPVPGVGSAQAASGLKAALAQGAEVAVAVLGRTGGFSANPEFRIPLPGALNMLGQGLRLAGQGARVDAFELSINRAAEAAVPAALDVLKQAIVNLTIQDALGILNGGDDAATQYLHRVGGDSIRSRMRPYVAQATDSVGVTRQYKALIGSAGGLDAVGGMLGGSTLDLDDYVTQGATEALFKAIAAEERRIRENPAARTTELLRRVFGS